MYTNVLHYNILKETKILLEFNLINIRYLTCSSLLICYSIGDPWKPHYGSHASYHKRAAVVKQRHHRYRIVLFWSNRCCTWMFVSDWIHFFIACYSYFSFFFFTESTISCQINLLLLQEIYLSQQTTDCHHYELVHQYGIPITVLFPIYTCESVSLVGFEG